MLQRASILTLIVLGLSLSVLWTAPVHADEIQWRTDYAAARREADEKKRPLLVEFGTDSCTWCRRLESTTFRDPAVVAMLNEQFIPLKINMVGDRWLAEALNVHSYPTLIYAAPDGTILEKRAGFVEVPQFTQNLQRALASVAEAVAEAQ